MAELDKARIPPMLAAQREPGQTIWSQLFVAPQHQHKGIGKKLLAFTRQHLPNEILLRTAVANAKAIAWYEREGFVRENSAGGVGPALRLTMTVAPRLTP